ncbi:g8248 [Coccomyxa elongata]
MAVRLAFMWAVLIRMASEEAWHCITSSRELSVQLLRFSFDDMERLKFWAPYFRNIPNKRELYSKYLFQRKHVPLLQDVQLEEFVIRVLDWTEAVYNGSASVTADRTLASLAHLPQAKLVQLEDFSHYAALLDSYSFGFPDEAGQPRRWLLPLMDMLNHNSTSNVNVIKDNKSQSFVAVALRDIREGEEVT